MPHGLRYNGIGRFDSQLTEQDGKPMVLEVPYPGRIVYAHIWRVNVGRIKLYLLDTDLDTNSEWDRPITYQLYGGDWELREPSVCRLVRLIARWVVD